MLFSLGVYLDSCHLNYIRISLQLSNINRLGKWYNIIMCFIIIRIYRRGTAKLNLSNATHCSKDQIGPWSLQWDSTSFVLKRIIFRWLTSSHIDNYRTFSRNTQLNDFLPQCKDPRLFLTVCTWCQWVYENRWSGFILNESSCAMCIVVVCQFEIREINTMKINRYRLLNC